MTPEGIAMLKRHEGLRLSAYLCPAGVPTIGYGHTGKVKLGTTISQQEADDLLAADVGKAERGAATLVPGMYSLDPVRQDALVNLVFNLGRTGLSKFKTFLRCVNARQWDAAASALVTSKWYRQVGNRAKDIVRLVRTGSYTKEV